MVIRWIFVFTALFTASSEAFSAEHSWAFGGCRMDVCYFTAFGDQVLVKQVGADRLWKVGTRQAVCRGDDYDDPFTSSACDVSAGTRYVFCSRHMPGVAVSTDTGLDGFRLRPGGTVSNAEEELNRTYWYVCHGVDKPDLGEETWTLARSLGYRVCAKPGDLSSDCQSTDGPWQLQSGEGLLHLPGSESKSSSAPEMPAMPGPDSPIRTFNGKSASAGIAAFAADWWWSKQRKQDGRYGETMIEMPTEFLWTLAIDRATLILKSGYSQKRGSAKAKVYIATSRAVTPKSTAHDKGKHWYGDRQSKGKYLGSYTTTYGNRKEFKFDLTEWVRRNKTKHYYIVVENLDRADIGVNAIRIEYTGQISE